MFRGRALSDIFIKLSERLVVDKAPSIFELFTSYLFCASRLLKSGFQKQLSLTAKITF